MMTITDVLTVTPSDGVVEVSTDAPLSMKYFDYDAIMTLVDLLLDAADTAYGVLEPVSDYETDDNAA